MERTFKKLVIGLAVGFGVVFLLSLVLDNPYTHRVIRAAIDEKARQHTNLAVDFKALKVNVLPPGIDLYALHVAPRATPGEPIVTASHAKARVSLWSLVMGEPRLALLEGHDVTVIWPPPWDFPGFLKEEVGPPAPEAPATWPPEGDLPLDRVVLSNARIFLEAQAFQGPPYAGEWLTLAVSGLDVDVRMDGFGEIDTDLDVKSVDLALGAASLLEATAVRAALELEGGRFKTTSLEVQGERLKLDGGLEGEIVTRGRQRLLEGVKLAVGGDVEGDLSLLGSYLDLADTRGPLKGSARVSLTIPVADKSVLGSEVGFAIEGEGRVQDGYLDGFRLFDSAARFKVTPDAVTLTDVDIRMGDVSYGKARGEIRLDDAMSFTFHGEPRLLQLGDLLGALGVDFSVFDAALDSPDLVVKGQGEPFSLSVRATTQMTSVVLPEIEYAKDAYPVAPSCRLDLQLMVGLTELDFAGTHGTCFQTNGKPLDVPAPGNTNPPAAAQATSRIAAEGKIHFDDAKGMDLTIRAESLDAALGQHFAQVALAGKGSGEARIHGPYDAILIDTKVSLDDAAAVGLPFGKLDGKVRVKGDDILFEGVTLAPKSGGRLAVRKGSLKLDEQLSLAFQLEGGGVPPDFMGGILQAAAPDVPLAFGIDAVALDVAGPLASPLAWHGRWAATLGKLTYEDETLLDTVELEAASDAKGIRADKVRARIGSFGVEAAARHVRAFPYSHAHAEASEDLWVRLGLHPDDELTVDYRTEAPRPGEMLPNHLGALPFVGALLGDAGVQGAIELQGRLTGRADDLQGTMTGRLRRPTVMGASLPDVELRGFVRDSKIDVMMTHLGNVLEGRMSVDVMGDGVPYDWYLDFKRMDVRAFGTSYFHADPRNYAYLTATWEMRGKLLDWWRSKGELTIHDIRGKFVQDVAGQTRFIALRTESPATLLFDPEGWRFKDDRELKLSGQHIDLRLSLPECKPPERLSLKLEGTVDLGLAREFAAAVDTATGKVKVIAEVIGPVSDPDLVVEITDSKPTPFNAATWQPVTLGLADLRPAFRNIRMRVFYAGGRLVIDSLEAEKGAGRIQASGVLNVAQDLDDESRLDFAFDGATIVVPVAFLKSFEMQLSGNASLSGNALPYRLTGNVKVDKARSTKEVDIRDEIVNALRRQAFATEVVSDKPLLELDLAITADRTININNRNLQSVLSAGLVVRGTDLAPSVTGQVEVDKGKFIYKRDFRIERGIVSFDDPVKPDPGLDILAVSEIDAYRVYIAITGRASNPTVEFAVDPPTRDNGSPISKVEILILLSRGSLPEENRSIGETQSAATSEAINLIMGQFEEPVEKLFDLSGQSVIRNVYFDTYPSQDGGNPVPRVNMPLNLGESFDVVLRADQSTAALSAEYSLHENIDFTSSFERHRADDSRQTSGSPQADTKLNLKFRFSFE